MVALELMALSREGLTLELGSQGTTLGKLCKRSQAMSCKHQRP